MKKRALFGGLLALGILTGLVLIEGRGSKPQRPYIYSDPRRSGPDTPVSKDGLITDIDYYVGLIDRVQADPYRQATKADFALKAAALRDRIQRLPKDTLPLIDCYYYLQELAAFLQDEHTEIIFQPEWQKSYPDRFPLDIRIFDKRAFVRRVLGGANVPRSAELISIADKTMEELLSEAQKFINVPLAHHKWQIAEKRFDAWLQTCFKIAPPWRIAYRFEGKEETVVVRGIPAEEFAKESEGDSLYSASSFMVDGENVPQLRIPRFWYPDWPRYERFVDDFFQKHKDKNYLVIDLRQNPGGDGRWGFFVLDHLMEFPYMTRKRFDFRISREFAELNYYDRNMTYYNKRIPRLLWWFPPIRSLHDSYWMDRVYQAKVGEYAEEHESYRTPDPEKAKFKGKTYLLVSHFTNSAAVVFSAIFKSNKLGTIVGQETGGRETFTSDPISIQMPNSRLMASIPVAVLALPGNNPDRGVLPDIVIGYSLEDVLNDEDLGLEKVKELIKNDRVRTPK